MRISRPTRIYVFWLGFTDARDRVRFTRLWDDKTFHPSLNAWWARGKRLGHIVYGAGR